MTHKPTAPALFAVTITPFAAAVGYVTISVPFWLARDGVSLADIGIMSGTAMAPHAIKFLWAPVLDVGAHRKVWFAVMAVLTAVFLAALALVPSPAQHLGLYTLIATLAQIASTTSAAAADGLMACTTAEKDKGKAGGWRMAGNVGSTGILGALAIWVATAANSVFIAGLTLSALCLASCIALAFIDEPHLEESGHHPDRTALRVLQLRLWAIGHDLWSTVRSRQGWTGLVICLMPVGAGALTNLFSAMAQDYGASESTVELVNGLGGGLSGMVGSLIGGVIADKMNRRVAYAISGGLTAISGIAMMLAPMTPLTYAWGTIVYCFANGIAFATLAAFILEMVGHSAAAATKYTLFIAIANVASSYVTILDAKGSVLNKIGSRGSLLADAVLTFAGIAVLVVMVKLAGKPTAPAVSGAPATES